MVIVIEEVIGGKEKCFGVPNFAYEIGNFTVGKKEKLEFEDFDDLDVVATIADACVTATGVRPKEWENNKDDESEEGIDLTVNLYLTKGRLEILYAFRGFLLRLGFIGEEFEADRKILLSKMDDSSTF